MHTWLSSWNRTIHTYIHTSAACDGKEHFALLRQQICMLEVQWVQDLTALQQLVQRTANT